jgi:hypothetical protein
MGHQFIIAYADKTVLKVSGLQIKGMNTQQLEQHLSEKLNSFVRVIGVTGEQIEMDVYNINPEQIAKDEHGLIQAIALIEGITVTDLTAISCNEKIVDVDFNLIPNQPISDCPRERWMKF